MNLATGNKCIIRQAINNMPIFLNAIVAENVVSGRVVD